MDFIEYSNSWAKSEVTQAQIMIGIGILFVAAFVGILKSEVELLRGSLLPMGVILVLLLGYGSFILYSRPAHAKESIALYQESKQEAIEQEKAKHINDNKAGKLLMKVYPALALVAIVVVMIVPTPYYKGMAIGFVLLFLTAFIMDNGFVTRSDAFLAFLDSLSPA